AFRIKITDDEDALKSGIQLKLPLCDILLMTGGVSVGMYDFVRKALLESGVEKLFYKVRQKPGKPIFAGKKEQKIIFALPGNPASVFTCFHVYVLPLLTLWKSGGNEHTDAKTAILEHSFEKKTGLTHFLKG